ncbi:MAG TPA: CHAP domain-containing protein [Acetobacteraceae bacterium]|nr:CHAP domain-containing protein [Acetobacteraceae bacterium]
MRRKKGFSHLFFGLFLLPLTAFLSLASPRPAQARYYFVSCVPYAIQRSGINLPGNAWQWWYNAAGHYARGQVPEPGAVLAFRSIRSMPLGHVAVVSGIVNSREILVDQANWLPAGVIRLGVPVVDVSPENDWTEVRVSIGGGHFGSDYPTYGFIYHARPGALPAEMVAENLPVPPMSPSDLSAIRASGLSNGGLAGWEGHVEVAEAPAPYAAPGGSALVSAGLQLDAPDHSIR